jgi:CubicO group peptidase (beta-lactamase class C family)
VERKGKIIHLGKFGYQDIAEKKPLEFDHIFRIYSMTKPLTSLALMMLLEQGKIRLFDPVDKYLPEFNDVKVLEIGGKRVSPKTPMTVHHLLTHTSGLTYGLFGDSEVDKLYQEQAKLLHKDQTLAEMIRRIASFPLVGHPGEQWVYSVSTDVVGRIVEVISGLSLGDFLEAKIIKPLGMVDTAFSVPNEKLDRLTTCYAETEKDKLAVQDHPSRSNFQNVKLHMGGGGLVSTIEDYLQFTRLFLNDGELNGVRLVGRKTIELMTVNHIDPRLFPLATQEPFPGFGFGLGFRVLLDLGQTRELGSVGTYGWGGAASTTFFIDPQEDMIGIMMSQYLPATPFSLVPDFRTLVYQALVD